MMIRLKSAALCAAAVATALGAMAFAPAPAAPAESKFAVIEVSRDGYNRRVRIHNQTGWTMLRFYASDSRKSSWEEDILGSSVLGNGRSVTINVDDGSGACVYDFKAEFTNGQVLTRMNVNVCQIADYYYTR
ncbi:MAG TPA: hypothetical protein PLQ03_03540 [Brevundimonas sp.]|uniref:hypothetical protein n=2 Tax=Brevundimonas TaxID=41275 RepID=UPI002B96BB30|nr:hypothetical protein [Brevundimonas sp.]HRO32463.1 hypothetical protein [Brevundimonas sp.]